MAASKAFCLYVVFIIVLACTSAAAAGKASQVTTGAGESTGRVHLMVMADGAPASKINVCVRYEVDSRIGGCGETDSVGLVELSVTPYAHQYRIENHGKTVWSPIQHVIPGESTHLTLNLDEIAKEITNNPEPEAIGSEEPVWTPPNTILASTGDVSGTAIIPPAPLSSR